MSKKILIADDDPIQLKLLEFFFEEKCWDAISVPNGHELLKQLEKQKIDLILMDIFMPVIDGYETAKKIKEDEKYKDIPIIALTASPTKPVKEKIEELGFEKLISKPFDKEEMLEIISQYLN